MDETFRESMQFPHCIYVWSHPTHNSNLEDQSINDQGIVRFDCSTVRFDCSTVKYDDAIYILLMGGGHIRNWYTVYEITMV